MKRLFHRLTVAWTCVATLSTGCAHHHYLCRQQGDLNYYLDKATQIEDPVVESCTLDEVSYATRPLTLQDFENHTLWDLTLEEATRIALTNSKILRVLGAPSSGTLRSPAPAPENLTRAAAVARSVYDPALQETNPVGLERGVEAALADFDAQLASGLFWEKNNRPINRTFGNDLFNPNFQQDRAVFRSELRKTTATGTRFFARHNVEYDANNNPAREVTSNWDTNFEFGVQQPLLQGAGAVYNRIAGPNGQVGVFNGVSIARVNNDLSLAEFEASVQQVLSDLERTYWQLYFMYRRKDITRDGRDRAHRAWQEAKAGGDEIAAAQAETEYFRFRGDLENALRDLFATENRLRYLMGLASSDGRLIRPADEPITAKLNFDWGEIHCEALVRNIDLRRQKWKVQQRELELIAAKNHVLPRLDAVALYRFLGSGDDLYHSNGQGLGAPPNQYAGSDAYSSLFNDDFEEWHLGLEFNMPLGFRRELAGVRHAQLQLARERALLQDQELEISHQLAEAVRNLESQYVLAQTNFNRWSSARHEVDLIEAARTTQRVADYTSLLNAYSKLVNAEEQYFESLLLYNLALVEVHYRKGSLLDYNGVYLAEGPWPTKAYADARRRARERYHAMPMSYAFTQPAAFSRGPVPQYPHCDYVDAIPQEDPPREEAAPVQPAPPVTPKSPPPPPTTDSSADTGVRQTGYEEKAPTEKDSIFAGRQKRLEESPPRAIPDTSLAPTPSAEPRHAQSSPNPPAPNDRAAKRLRLIAE